MLASRSPPSGQQPRQNITRPLLDVTLQFLAMIMPVLSPEALRSPRLLQTPHAPTNLSGENTPSKARRALHLRRPRQAPR